MNKYARWYSKRKRLTKSQFKNLPDILLKYHIHKRVYEILKFIEKTVPKVSSKKEKRTYVIEIMRSEKGVEVSRAKRWSIHSGVHSISRFDSDG